MTEQTIDSHENDQEVELGNNELAFKTASFIQNDLLLSLLYFGLILFLPLAIWDHIDHTLIYRWQGCMITITAARWLCRLALVTKIQPFWDGALTFLTLLDGLGWGIVAALLFPVDSTLAMSLTALFLIGIGGVGAVSYSARMLVAIPYLLCVILPYTTRLYLDGGNTEFLIANTLSLLVIMFSFTADRLNINLRSALKTNRQDEEAKLVMKNEIYRQEKNLEKAEAHSKNIEVQLTNNSQEMEDVHKTISQYREELNLLAGKSINLLNDLESLKQTHLDHDQNKLIKKIEENARHLSSTLNESDESDHSEKMPININKNPSESSETIRVLVVDDNRQEANNIEACLHDLNIGYQSVENVPAALAIICEAEANNKYFDLIIANMWMPDMDGVSFAECLQDDPEFQEIKIILISSGKLPSEKRLKNAGVDLVINKPLIAEELTLAINNLTGKKTSTLPASIEALINDAVQVSIPTSKHENQNTISSSIIDRYVIDGLRSSATSNFIEIVNDFLEEAPQLIEQAKTAYGEKNSLKIKKSIHELGSRSIHMGAVGLVQSAKDIEEAIDSRRIESVMGMLQLIDAEFIRVESALLAELTNGFLLSDEFKH